MRCENQDERVFNCSAIALLENFEEIAQKSGRRPDSGGGLEKNFAGKFLNPDMGSRGWKNRPVRMLEGQSKLHCLFHVCFSWAGAIQTAIFLPPKRSPKQIRLDRSEKPKPLQPGWS